MIRALLSWTLGFSVLVLSGCASVYAPQNLQLGEWVRSGRFSMLVQDPQKPDVFLQGRFFWQDLQQGLTLDLSSPVGVTLARIEVQPKQSVLKVPGEPPVSASTADELLVNVLAEPVPIQALRYWMQGRLSSTLQAYQIQRDSDQRLTSFKAGQWSVSLSRYDEQGPTFLSMTQNINQRVVTLKLIVDAQP